MKRLNEKIEKRIQELGLDKDNRDSYDIAMESLVTEVSDYSVLRNPQTGGLWLGGMDRGRNRTGEMRSLASIIVFGEYRYDPGVIVISSDDDDSDSDDMEVGEGSGTPEPVNEVEQLGSAGGDFWEALKRVRERTSEIEAEELIEWTPSNISGAASVSVPSLEELSFNVLVESANCKASLNVVPDLLQKKLIDHLCDNRKMDAHALEILAQGYPTELRVKNCAWVSDYGFCHQLVETWKTENLTVLKLDHGVQIEFDCAFRDKLARSQNSFSMLSELSLRGSCCLTDYGVELLVKSAPKLVSVNLGLCSLVTSESVKSIADYLGKHLRELYIDGCENIKAMQIASDIMMFKKLEVFSVANLKDVSDAFIELLVGVCGESLKDLDMADCLELTDSSLKAVASHCPGLLGLNISSLLKVTNVGMEFLANGCRSIQRLNLTKTKFSDEVIAAFIEISGESLTKLTLNRVSQVGPNTAFSLARRSRKLSYLDISCCRRISTNAICLIADSCLSLELVKIFKCEQISDMILNGHSNPKLRVIRDES